MISVTESLVAGTRYHQAGQLAEAEKAYRQILATDPGHPQALHQLGILLMQVGDFGAAVDLLARAIRCDRSQAAVHGHLGEAFRQLGKFAEAEKCYRDALKIQPNVPQWRIVLGVVLMSQGRLDESTASLREALQMVPEDLEARLQLGRALEAQKKLTEAEACFRRVLRSDNRSAGAHFQLGNCLHQQDKLDEAAACYRQALELNPDYVDAHNNLGSVLISQGRQEEAAMHCLSALKIQPGCAVAQANLGAVRLSQRQFDEAAICYRAALEVDPGMLFARYNLGRLLQRRGQYTEALSCFDEVVRVEPQNALAHLARGSVFQVQDDYPNAMACYQEALRIDPNYVEAYNDIGFTWCDQGRQDEAIENYRRAIALRPGFAQAHNNLGVSLQALGRLDESIEHYRKAVELDPGNAAFHGSLLYVLNYHPGSDAASLFAEHRAWGQRHADPLTADSPPHANDRNPSRRLRVGYVSPHFKAQAITFFSEPIVASHDHSQVEVFCYSAAERPDFITPRFQAYADHWREIAWMTDQQAAEIVRRDQIDILVDLTGHIGGGGRLLLFARKPAPIQVTYIGYQNTTGMLAMDYRLTDDYADPPGLTDAFHTEKLVRLPRTFFCYQPSSDAPPVTPLPALANGYVTFASINNFNKVTPEVLKTWAALLLRVPNSRLIVRADMTDSLVCYLRETFAGHGVDSARLELANRMPRHDYLELISRADIALDPFPFNGHTTTCDCLWQGVPVLTLSGSTYVSRFGGSGLVTLGLEEWIARTTEEYVEIGARMAGDLDRLAELRSGLRARMAQSPLLDFQTFTRNLEAAYRKMWVDWCATGK